VFKFGHFLKNILSDFWSTAQKHNAWRITSSSIGMEAEMQVYQGVTTIEAATMVKVPRNPG